jgi:hypothetical protein
MYGKGKLVKEAVETLASKIFKPKTELDALEPVTVKPSILRREAVPLNLTQVNEISKNKEFEQAWKNYKISIRKVGRRKYDKDQFFEIWARENMAQGGRTGYADKNAGKLVKKLNMDYFRHGTRSDDPTRLKKINDYVENFEEDYGIKPTAKNIRTNLNEQRRVIPFYEEEYGKLPKGKGTRISNVQNDVVKILKDPKIIAKLEAGKFPTITDVSRITKLDATLAETRLVDLAEKLRDNPKYKTIADNYFDKPGVSSKDEIFGGKKGKRSRVILENRFSKLMELDQKLPSLRTNILRKIQSFIPDLKGLLSVDEIAGITSSMRRGSGPYAIFGQVIGSDFNTMKGRGIDKDKGILEKQLVKLDKKDPKRIKLQKKYNESITEFENKANVDNPAKKVRGLKVSYKPPSETIKNKKIYTQYKDLFDEHYKKYGYSFEVPADRDSLVDISKKLDNKSFQNIVKNRFKSLIGKGGKIGALAGLGTLAGTGFALADEEVSQTPFPGMKPQGSPGQLNPETEEGLSTGEKVAAGTAAAGTIGTKVGRKALGNAFNYLGLPATLALNTVYKPDVINSTADRVGVGAELAFAPSLVKATTDITSKIKNPLLRKAAEIGSTINPKYAMRAATIAQPLGIGTLLAQGGYEMAKPLIKESKRIDAIDDYETQEAEMENFIKTIRGY